MPFWSKKEKDPVCGMDVNPKKAAATFEYQSKTYYFCAPSCKADFSNDPEKYLKGPPGAAGGMSMGHQ
ncbi:MAG: YHS domain-containing protein [Dehalococcoidia bacterium]